MGAQGVTFVDFGALPGSFDATATVTGQAAIVATSLADAWLYPPGLASATPLHALSADGTADHTGDEHVVDGNMAVSVTAISAGVGFTIKVAVLDNTPRYGKYAIAWVWN